jgi:hypothetical protein
MSALHPSTAYQPDDQFNPRGGWTRRRIREVLHQAFGNDARKCADTMDNCMLRLRPGWRSAETASACAVGAFIPDDVYMEGMEALTCRDLYLEYPDIDWPLGVMGMAFLQGEHDCAPNDEPVLPYLLRWVQLYVSID